MPHLRAALRSADTNSMPAGVPGFVLRAESNGRCSEKHQPKALR